MISRESFESASEETKLLLIYDMLVEHTTLLSDHITKQTTVCKVRRTDCNTRFLGLEKRKILNTTVAGLGGILGGIAAIWAGTAF